MPPDETEPPSIQGWLWACEGVQLIIKVANNVTLFKQFWIRCTPPFVAHPYCKLLYFFQSLLILQQWRVPYKRTILEVQV